MRTDYWTYKRRIVQLGIKSSEFDAAQKSAFDLWSAQCPKRKLLETESDFSCRHKANRPGKLLTYCRLHCCPYYSEGIQKGRRKK